MTAWAAARREILKRACAEADPCEHGQHCMCIEDGGIPSRRKGLILVTVRCCRCRKTA